MCAVTRAPNFQSRSLGMHICADRRPVGEGIAMPTVIISPCFLSFVTYERHMKTASNQSHCQEGRAPSVSSCRRICKTFVNILAFNAGKIV